MPFAPGHDIDAAHRWRKGESGNPKGRSKLDIDLTQAARAHSAEMLDIAVRIARDENGPPESRLGAVEIVPDPRATASRSPRARCTAKSGTRT